MVVCGRHLAETELACPSRGEHMPAAKDGVWFKLVLADVSTISTAMHLPVECPWIGVEWFLVSALRYVIVGFSVSCALGM